MPNLYFQHTQIDTNCSAFEYLEGKKKKKRRVHINLLRLCLGTSTKNKNATLYLKTYIHSINCILNIYRKRNCPHKNKGYLQWAEKIKIIKPSSYQFCFKSSVLLSVSEVDVFSPYRLPGHMGTHTCPIHHL